MSDDATTPAEPCDAEARIEGLDGPITLGRCFLPQGHPLPHSAPFDRLTWGGCVHG